jgi:hypothetical protein
LIRENNTLHPKNINKKTVVAPKITGRAPPFALAGCKALTDYSRFRGASRYLYDDLRAALHKWNMGHANALVAPARSLAVLTI